MICKRVGNRALAAVPIFETAYLNFTGQDGEAVRDAKAGGRLELDLTDTNLKAGRLQLRSHTNRFQSAHNDECHSVPQTVVRADNPKHLTAASSCSKQLSEQRRHGCVKIWDSKLFSDAEAVTSQSRCCQAKHALSPLLGSLVLPAVLIAVLQGQIAH